MKHVAMVLGTMVSVCSFACGGAGPEGPASASIAESASVTEAVAESVPAGEAVDRGAEETTFPSVTFVAARGCEGLAGTWRGQVYSRPHGGYYEFTAQSRRRERVRQGCPVHRRAVVGGHAGGRRPPGRVRQRIPLDRRGGRSGAAPQRRVAVVRGDVVARRRAFLPATRSRTTRSTSSRTCARTEPETASRSSRASRWMGSSGRAAGYPSS